MNEEERLLEELEKAREENSEAFQKCPPNLSYPDFQDYMKQSSKKLCEASRKYRMVETPSYSELSTFGHIMSLEDFIDNVKCGGFIDYDGYGNYVKDGKTTDINIHPSDVKHGAIRKDFDTIVWYNR